MSRTVPRERFAVKTEKLFPGLAGDGQEKLFRKWPDRAGPVLTTKSSRGPCG